MSPVVEDRVDAYHAENRALILSLVDRVARHQGYILVAALVFGAFSIALGLLMLWQHATIMESLTRTEGAIRLGTVVQTTTDPDALARLRPMVIEGLDGVTATRVRAALNWRRITPNEPAPTGAGEVQDHQGGRRRQRDD